MLNEPPNRNASNQRQQITLRIPSVAPVMTVSLLLLFGLVFIVALFDPTTAAGLIARAGIQGEAVLQLAGYHRLLSGLLLVEQPIAPGAWIEGAAGLLGLYTFYIVGMSTEKLWGSVRFALVYVLGGMAGALISLLLAGLNLIPPDVYLAGAPGAFLAGLGAELVYLYKHRKLYARQAVLRRNYLLGLLALNLVLGAFAPRVDLFGLLGGLGGGALLAAFISPYHLPRPHPDEPGALLGEDVNPLRGRVVPLLLYVSGLLGVLIVAVLAAAR